jgi:ketol-acid reductoisomerase
MATRPPGASGVEAAERDGFTVHSIADAVAQADIVALLIPDEVQQEVFSSEVRSGLREGTTLVVASGYSLFYGLLALPERLDAVMVAPRMVGSNVRLRYVDGTGSPSFLSIERDATGDAAAVALAYAEAIGCTRMGCFASSSREEVALDLFGEQALWPAILQLLEIAYEVLTAAGFSDLATIYELYVSGEPAEIFENAARLGLLGQLSMHSPASQIGQLTGSLPEDASTAVRERFRDVLQSSVLDGSFVASWHGREQAEIDSRLAELFASAAARPMHAAEERVRRAITSAQLMERNA